MNQERNERRLIDVSPLQVVAAGNVVELVAEVTVAVVEVNMEYKIGQRNGPDHRHAIREERLSATVGSREGSGSSIHRGIKDN